MKDVGFDDYYEVRKMGLVSDLDRQSLVELYGPLVGMTSVGVYLSLLEDHSVLDGVTLTHQDLLSRLGLKPGEFFKAMEPLEAMGLVKTYFNEAAKVRYFVYAIYSPKDPREFFDDVLFVGTLRKRIGDESINALLAKYKTAEEVKGFEDVSESFMNYFSPDFSSDAFVGATGFASGGHKVSHIKTNFNFSAFLDEIKTQGIEEKKLSKTEIRRIEKLATLYEFDAKTIANILVHNYKEGAATGKRVDFYGFESECRQCMNFSYLKVQDKTEKSEFSSDTALAQKIRAMESMTPRQWLSMKQNGHKPADSDLRVVESLALDIGLSNPVINVLIDYVLATNNNILSKSLCEKIGASLMREGVKTALDAMDYLKKTSKKKAPQPKGSKPAGRSNYNKPVVQEKPEEVKKDDEVSDEELEAALALL